MPKNKQTQKNFHIHILTSQEISKSESLSFVLAQKGLILAVETKIGEEEQEGGQETTHTNKGKQPSIKSSTK